MHPPNDNITPRNVERELFEADQTLNQLVAQSPDEVKEMEAMFGSTPCELPERLRDAKDVLEAILTAHIQEQQHADVHEVR